MHTGKLIFSQVMDHLPLHEFRKCVQRYHGQYKVQRFSCLDQLLTMAFAQLTQRESLRDIEACLRAHHTKLYHMGIRGRIAKSTLADANETRDWRMYADFAQVLIGIARPLYAQDPSGVHLQETVYALDATIIDLCLASFPWATFRRQKGAVKVHTLLDLRGALPAFINITAGSVHEVNIMDQLVYEAGAFYVMDRGYVDFARLFRINTSAAYFVIRAKRNLNFVRRYSHTIEKRTGVRCDQTILVPNYYSAQDYPVPLRRICYVDPITQQGLCFLTNHFDLPAETVAQLYKCRWQVELFFKWIKQHLRIKRFYGTSENAVKTQIWIAVTVYVLVAILKKRLAVPTSLYTFLQILSVTLFERMPIECVFAGAPSPVGNHGRDNQLQLFS